MARVRAVLRRREVPTGSVPETTIIRIEKLEINVSNYKARIGERDLQCTRREFETLVYLARNRDRVVTREQLLNEVWGHDVHVVDRTVDVHISKIREKLGSYGEYIETVKGVGYRMRGEE
jgi:two-component system, OmpR family, alkaline phosphatase synthesis response regulator PhoP